MLPEYFTVTDLIKQIGGDTDWAKDPRLTAIIAQELRLAGFTQRMIHERGAVHRTWSRNWKGKNNRDRGKAMEKGKLELIAKLKELL